MVIIWYLKVKTDCLYHFKDNKVALLRYTAKLIYIKYEYKYISVTSIDRKSKF